jgi:hypothetical protein
VNKDKHAHMQRGFGGVRFVCHQFYQSYSILIVNHRYGIVSPTLIANSTLFVIPCRLFGDNRFTWSQLLSIIKCFFIQMLIIRDNISSQVADMRRWGFGQWMNSSIIHDNICKLIHKKFHPKVTI